METKANPTAFPHAAGKKSLPLADLKKIVADLFAVNPWIYWADFLGSVAVSWASFLYTEQAPALSVQELIGFTVTVFALYRAALFIHELTHQERRTLPGFSVAWNLLVG